MASKIEGKLSVLTVTTCGSKKRVKVKQRKLYVRTEKGPGEVIFNDRKVTFHSFTMSVPWDGTIHYEIWVRTSPVEKLGGVREKQQTTNLIKSWSSIFLRSTTRKCLLCVCVCVLSHCLHDTLRAVSPRPRCYTLVTHRFMTHAFLIQILIGF